VRRTKVVSVEVAVQEIPDHATISVCGAWMNVPDSTLEAIEKRFLETAHPRDLTAIFAICPGGLPGQPGIDRLAHEGLLRCAIGGSYPNAESRLRSLISRNLITAYNIPSGMIAAWYREIGAGRPGVLVQAGLGTFVDPRQSGGRMNAATKEQILEVTSLGGGEYLFLPSRPIDIAIIRATTADEAGNLTFEQESATMTAFVQAVATRASGGIVIAQVKRVVKVGALNPHHVKVPGTLVDYIVVDETQKQTGRLENNPALSGEVRQPWPAALPGNEVELAIARRAAKEIRDGDVVVVGYGIAAHVPQVLLWEGRLENVDFMIEQGSTGGLPLTDFDFGNSLNPQVILDSASQFDLLQGGCFDVGILSFMQVDQDCRLNVHLLNARPTLSVGIGGFLDIANSGKRLILLGFFTAGGLKVEMHEGNVRILQEGKSKKFVRQIDNISFDARYCMAREILFITERAVLRWTDGYFEVIEVAPGVDVDRDVLDQMEFIPRVAATLQRRVEV
jgi:propionate CoA-transferase